MMKRAVRILLKAAGALSMLLCAVSIVLWGRGGLYVYSLWRTQGRTVYEIEVSRGELGLFLEHEFDAHGFVPDSSARWQWRMERSGDLGGDLDYVAMVMIPTARPPVHGFFFGRAGSTRVVLFPLPFVFAVLALPPLTAVACEVRRRRGIRRRARRARGGQCAECGYDLHATPDRCPECGTIATR